MTQLRSIEESKQPRKSKCGILPFISNFEVHSTFCYFPLFCLGNIYSVILDFQEFSNIIENIFRTSERRVDVDKWYTRLVRAMFDVLPRIAVENTKTPAEMIKMGTPKFFSSIMDPVSKTHAKLMQKIITDSTPSYPS